MNTAFVTAAPVRSVHNSALVFSSTPRTSNISPRRPAPASITMGKNAKFGPFTPAVLTAKVVLGDKRLNKVRGKAIALHSQVITAFCEFTGAGPKMRASLIRQAKDNGDTLGFLS